MENNNIHDKEDVHKFSAEYKARKERILDGIKEVEKSEDQTSKKKYYGGFGRFTKVAVILICAVVLLPVSIHAAVTVYRFTVNRDGHTATVTIQMSEDVYSQEGMSGENATAEDTADLSDIEKRDIPDECYSEKVNSKVGSDGLTYSVDPDRRYVEIKFSYLPAGMVQVEENKYDVTDGELDMGISVAASEWDGKSYDVVNRDVGKAQTLKAGDYEYQLFERGGVDYSFNRLAYIPVKEHSVIVTMYVGRSITETDLSKVIAGMSINEEIGDDPAKWTLVEDDVQDDADAENDRESFVDETKDRFTIVNVNEKFIKAGYEMTVNGIKVYDNTCKIPESDITYWFGDIDSRFVDKNGKFKTVRCRRLNETTDNMFSTWDDCNDSSLRMVVVDMTYEGVEAEGADSAENVLDFYLDRGEINGSKELQTPETTNYYYAGYDASAQNSQKMTFVSPAYVEIDGQKADVHDVEVVLDKDSEKHDLKVYFLVDKSEINDSYMFVSSDDGYSQSFDYVSVYLGDAE